MLDWKICQKNKSNPSSGEDRQAIWAYPESRAFYHVLLKVVQADVLYMKVNSRLAQHGPWLPEYMNEGENISQLLFPDCSKRIKKIMQIESEMWFKNPKGRQRCDLMT